MIKEALSAQKKSNAELWDIFSEMQIPEPPNYHIYIDYFNEANFIGVYPMCTTSYFDWMLCYTGYTYRVDVTQVVLPEAFDQVNLFMSVICYAVMQK